jgi:hypothetical protein
MALSRDFLAGPAASRPWRPPSVLPSRSALRSLRCSLVQKSIFPSSSSFSLPFSFPLIVIISPSPSLHPHRPTDRPLLQSLYYIHFTRRLPSQLQKLLKSPGPVSPAPHNQSACSSHQCPLLCHCIFQFPFLISSPPPPATLLPVSSQLVSHLARSILACLPAVPLLRYPCVCLPPLRLLLKYKTAGL